MESPNVAAVEERISRRLAANRGDGSKRAASSGSLVNEVNAVIRMGRG